MQFGSKTLVLVFVFVTACAKGNNYHLISGVYAKHENVCYGPSVIDSYFPTKGPEEGGTNITISGRGLPLHPPYFNQSILCYFDEEIFVNAHYTFSSTWVHNSITCVTPGHMPGKVKFSIKICGQMIEPKQKNREFEYTMASSVFSVSPRSGSMYGGTMVTVIGNNFINSTNLMCKFDNMVAHASFLTTKKVQCKTPSMNFKAKSAVTVTNNGIDFEEYGDHVYFSFIPAPIIHYMGPNSAPTSGGTLLKIYGEFEADSNKTYDDVFCKIGNREILATSVASNLITCITPFVFDTNFTNELVNVEISTNGGADFSNCGKTILLLHPTLQVFSLQPSLGPEYGGTTVNVLGANFVRTKQLLCEFDDVQVEATWISVSLLQCQTPPSRPRVVTFKISSNGQLSGYSTGYLEFTYFNAVTLSSIHPSYGSYKGGTLITVKGTGFFNSSSFCCRFGGRIIRSITFIDSTTIVCESPPMTQSDNKNAIILQLSANFGHDVTFNEIEFTYAEPYFIQSIHPRLGPKGGGTLVFIHIRAENHNSKYRTLLEDDEIACRFGKNRVVPGYLSKEDEIFCKSPPFLISSFGSDHATAVTLEVTTNGIDYTFGGIQFTYHPTVTISSISPMTGSENGGTIVTITGKNFLRSESLSCFFGNSRSPSVTWMSPTTLKCVSPALLYNYYDNPVVNVSVSLNGLQNHNESNTSFFYQPLAHISYLQPSHGSILGGYEVHVIGGGFTSNKYSNSYCKFGDEKTMQPAQILSDSEITCVAPSKTFPSTVLISLSFNSGHEYTFSDNVRFVYTSIPVMTKIFPNVIPYNNKVLVYVTGKNLWIPDNQIIFSIGGMQVDALSFNDTHATFYAPKIRSSNKTFEVFMSTNGGYEYLSNNFNINYVFAPEIEKIVPPFAHELGNINVTIYGKNFISTPDLSCLVSCKDGNLLCGVSPAVFVSRDEIICIVPQSSCKFGEAKIEVSMTGNFHESNPEGDFRYNPLVSVFSIQPDTGPVTGGTKIVVKGSFWLDGDFACTFGEYHDDRIFTLATLISPTQIECLVPPSPHDKPGEILFSVSIVNEKKIYDAGEVFDTFFLYAEGVFILDVTPSSGSARGGTEIHLKGSNFINSTYLECIFLLANQSLKTEAFYFNHEHISCITPVLNTTLHKSSLLAQLKISSNGVDFSETYAHFWYYPVIEIYDINPYWVSEEEGSIITVFGKYFQPHHDIKCSFKSINKIQTSKKESASIFLSSKMILCNTPNLFPGRYRVGVSNNESEMISYLPTALVIHNKVFPMALIPSAGPLHGGTQVKISGRSFVNSTTLSCKFGLIATKAIFLSNSEIQCISPRQDLPLMHEVNVSLSINGQDFFNPENLVFSYILRPTLNDVHPLSGPIHGGTMVTIKGNHLTFRSQKQSKCRFGSNLVEAKVLDDNTITCSSPQFNGTINTFVTLDVSNGYEFSNSGFVFIYQDLPHLVSIHAPVGTEAGGNKVKVHGFGFQSNSRAACSFGSDISNASLVTFDYIMCLAPMATKPGSVKVEVTLNGIDWTTQELLYTFIPIASISEIIPKRGPLNGGVMINIRGQNFFNSSESSKFVYFCNFGGVSSVATLVNENLFSCISPPYNKAKEINFDLVLAESGLSITENKNNLKFEYFAPGTISSIKPPHGNLEGGTLLRIKGSGFKGHEDMMCQFQLSGLNVTTTVTSFNDTFALCSTPNTTIFCLEDEIASKLFLVDNFGVKISSKGWPFLFKKNPQILRITPRIGQMKGGTSVEVIALPGSGWWVNSHLLFCLFGMEKTQAIWISSLKIRCVSPRLKRSTTTDVLVSVTDNEVEFGTGHIKFSYVDPPTVTSIHPTSGSNIYGTTVEVRGNGFYSVGNPTCWFGNKQVIGVVINTDFMQCIVPQMNETGKISLFFSNNGVELSKSYFQFELILPPVVSSLFPDSSYINQRVEVTVTGINFNRQEGQKQFCSLDRGFQHLSIATITSSKALTCSIFCPLHSPLRGRFFLEVSMNSGHYYTSNKIPFFCDPPPLLNKLSPSFVTTGYKSNFTIFGSGFRPRIGLSCIFDGLSGMRIVEATYVDDTKIQCSAPLWKMPQDITVYTSNNRIGYPSNSSTSLFVVEETSVSGIFPRKILPGSSVNIVGNSFFPTDSMSCMIGSISTKDITILDSKNAICKVPYDILPQDNVGITISLDGIFYSDVTIDTTAMILASPQITNVRPLIGPTTGGTHVFIIGKNLDHASLFCGFGESIISPEILSQTKVMCRSPSTRSQKVVPLFLSMDKDGKESREIAQFSYFTPVRIQNIHPKSGPSKGGTHVHINGDFSSDLPKFGCLFGFAYVPATILSPTTIVCDSPSTNKPGNRLLSLMLEDNKITLSVDIITQLNKNYSYLGEFSFLYYDDLTLTGIHPNNGPLNGGTLVHFFFDGQLNNERNDLSSYCKFGETIVDGNMSAKKSIIECLSPPSKSSYPSNVTVSISLNGVDFSMQHYEFSFTSLVEISTISPRNGPTSGGTFVTITGSNFHSQSYAKCKFGSDGKLAFATFRNDNEIICQTPAIERGSNVKLFLCFGYCEDWFETDFFFQYLNQIIVSNVYPKNIQSSIGSIIHVYGSGFQDDTLYYCRFSTLHDNFIVPAHYSSFSMVTCMTPININASVTEINLSLSSNLVDYVNSPFVLIYQQEISLLSLTPMLGPATGGTNITVYGSAFEPKHSYHCLFGDHAVMALFISSNSINCTSASSFLGISSITKVGVSQNTISSLISSHSLSFFQYKRLDLIVEPALGPTSGGTLICILGLEDILSELAKEDIQHQITILFHEHQIIGEILSKTVTFSTPRMNIGDKTRLVINISISLNGGANYENNLKFTLYQNPKLIGIEPQVIPQNGGVNVIITGENFFEQETSSCRFGSFVNRARFLSNSQINCTVPFQRFGLYPPFVSVSFSGNGQDYTPDALTLHVALETALHALMPQYVSDIGGSLVTIIGRNMPVTNNISMLLRLTPNHESRMFTLSNVVKAKVYNSSVCSFVTPHQFFNQINSTSVSISFSIDGVNFIESGLEVEFTPPISLISISPEISSLDGEQVIIRGENFVKSHHLSCLISYVPGLFGNPINHKPFDLLLEAYVFNATYLSCDLPPVTLFRNKGNEGLSVQIQVARFNGEKSHESLNLMYSNEFVIFSLVPENISEKGDSNLTVIGDRFGEFSHLFCLFVDQQGSKKVSPANVLSKTLVKCLTPPLTIGKANFFLINKYSQYQSNGLQLAVRGIRQILSISPHKGHISGGTKIKVLCSGFIYHSRYREIHKDIFCKFDDKISPALILNSTLIECSSPSTNRTASVSFAVVQRLSTDGSLTYHNFDDFNKKFTFQYSSKPTIIRIDPTSTISTKSAVIFVHGSGFSNSTSDFLIKLVSIEFPDKSVTVKVSQSSPNLIILNIPPSPFGPGEFMFDATMKNIDFSEGAKPFFYTKPHILVGLKPNVIPEFSQIELFVKVEKLDWNSPGALRCNIGGTMVSATKVDELVIKCTTPANLSVGIYSVNILSFQHDTNLLTSNDVLLQVRPQLRIFNSFPLCGPLSGGTRVTIVGNGFDTSVNQLYCIFGDIEAVAPNILNDTHVECISPRYRQMKPEQINGSSQPIVNLYLGTKYYKIGNSKYDHIVKSTDNLNTDFLFMYYVEEPIHVEPKLLPNYGKTTLVIRGGNFSSSCNISCRFGNEYTVPANLINASTISCVSPTLIDAMRGNTNNTANGLWRTYLSIAKNGMDFHMNRFNKLGMLYYYNDPHLFSINPAFGPIEGGIEVEIHGSYFPSLGKPLCRFGYYTVPAKIKTTTSLTCTTPKASGNAWGNIHQVQVSLNGVDFSRSFLKFEYSIFPILFHLMPAHGPVGGGNVVTLFGSNFATTKKRSLLCLFDDLHVIASVQSSEEASCIAPSHQQGAVLIDVAWSDAELLKHKKFNAHSIVYTYLDIVNIASVFPRFGTILGGTNLTIIGSSLPDISNLCCIFGNVNVSAMWRSEDKISCVSPKKNDMSPEIVGLFIGICVESSFQHAIISSFGAQFKYTKVPVVSNIFPTRGMTNNNGDIDVKGVNFVLSAIKEDAKCRFGEIGKSHADVISSTMLRCPIPSPSIELTQEVQEINIFGMPSQKEVQLIEIISPPLGFEEQMIVIEACSSYTWAIAQTLRVIVRAETSMSGTFTLSYLGEETPPLPINTEASKLETYLQNGIFKNVSVDLVTNPGITGAFVAWDISIHSACGGIDSTSLICNSSGIKSVWSDEVICDVTEMIASNSTKLGGTFSLSYHGVHTDMMQYDASGSDVSIALNKVFAFNAVSVTRFEWPRDFAHKSGLAWVITFKVPQNYSTSNHDKFDWPMLAGNDQFLIGTNVRFSISEIKKGNVIGGMFSLSFLGQESDHAKIVSHDASSITIATALESFPFVEKVDVTRELTKNGTFKWFCTFSSIVGNPSKIMVDDALIVGSDVSVEVIEVVNGSNPIGGFFNLVMNGARTQSLHIFSPAQQVKYALESLPNIEEVFVTLELNITDKRTQMKGHSFLVTFISIREPNPPLIVVDDTFVTGTETFITVKRKNTACCPIEVTFNGVDYYGGANVSDNFFTFTKRAVIKSIIPSHGITMGGTNVTVVGDLFFLPKMRAHERLICIFGDRESSGVWINSTAAECITPPHRESQVIVNLRHPKVDYKRYQAYPESKARFHFVPISLVSFTSPKFIPVVNQGYLGVFGEHFLNTTLKTCRYVYGSLRKSNKNRFGMKQFTTNVLFHNSTFVECLGLPSHESVNSSVYNEWTQDPSILNGTNVTMQLTFNGMDWTEPYNIRFIANSKIVSISPNSGPISGDTDVSVFGKNFIDSNDLACKFGNSSLVKATFLSSSEIKCISPSVVTTERIVEAIVVVTNNAHHFTQDSITFTFYDKVFLRYVSPKTGPVIGGTVVKISLSEMTLLRRITLNDKYLNLSSPNIMQPTMQNFTNHVERKNNESFSLFGNQFRPMCKFNDSVIPAMIIGRFDIACTSPENVLTSGDVNLFVSLNEGHNWEDHSSVFTFFPWNQTSLSMNPSHGPATGGTLVKITGISENIVKNLQDQWSSMGALCKFGTFVFKATIVSRDGNHIVCKSPKSPIENQALTIPVDLSIDGNSNDFLATGLYFTYDADLNIHRISPSWGSSLGGVPVRVLGGPFSPNYEENRCRFGDEIVNASWINHGEIRCISPKLGSVDEVQSVDIFSMAWVPEILTIKSSAEDYMSEIHTISTHGSKTPKSEIQNMHIQVEDTNEVQHVATKMELSGDISLDIKFAVSSAQSEIQKLTLSYKSSMIETKMISIIPFSTNDRSGFVQEVQKVTIECFDLLNSMGKFDLIFKDSTITNISVGSSALLLKELFNTHFDVMIEASVESNLPQTRSWIITFDSSLGNVPILKVVNTNDDIITHSVITQQEGSVQEIQRINVSSNNEEDTWVLSFDGVEWTRKLPIKASSNQVASALMELDQLHEVLVEYFFDTSTHIYEVTFIDYIGDAPLLMGIWNSSSSNIKITEVRKGTSLFDGYFSMSIGNQHTPDFLIPTVTASDIEFALSKLKSITYLSVTDSATNTKNGIHLIISFIPTQENITIGLHSRNLVGPHIISSIITLNDASKVDGEFEILVDNRSFSIIGGKTIKTTGPLPIEISEMDLQNSIKNLHSSWSAVEVRENTQLKKTNTKEWFVTFPPYCGNVNLLEVNANGIIANEGRAVVEEIQRGGYNEIQSIVVDAEYPVRGSYSLYFKGYKTASILWNASAYEVKKSLEALPTLGSVHVNQTKIIKPKKKIAQTTLDIHVDKNEKYFDYFTLYSWDVTFLSYAGDVPNLEACCDSFTYDAQQTISSGVGHEVLINVREKKKGSSEALSGHFNLITENYPSGIEKSENIPIDANISDVKKIIANMSIFQCWTSISVSRFITDEVNDIFHFNIKFSGIKKFDSAINVSRSPKINVETVITGTNASSFVSIKPEHWIQKEVQRVQYSRSTRDDMITCDDGTGNGKFSFHSLSTADTVERSMASVKNPVTNTLYYGIVSVSKRTSTDFYYWFLTFLEAAGDLPEIICSDFASTLTIHNGTSTSITGGIFTLRYKNKVTAPIPFDATGDQVKFALEQIEDIGEDNIMVSDGYAGSATRNGERSWFITFTGKNVESDIPLLIGNTDFLSGTNSRIHVTEIQKGSHVTGHFRLKVNDIWSNPIPSRATPLDMENALKSIEGVDFVEVRLISGIDVWGGLSFEIKMPHVIHSPNAFIPLIAGNIPTIEIDSSNLTGGNITAVIHTIQNGTDPISDDEQNRGFRLLTPGGSKTYPLTSVTRWLHFNESAESMKSALMETTKLPPGFTVSRYGPYDDGSFQWKVFLPKGSTFNGDTFWVVRDGGGSIKLHGTNANVTSTLTRAGTNMLGGQFRLILKNGNSSLDTASDILNFNATEDEIKIALEKLDSITEVQVKSESNDYNQSGNGAMLWMITFTSLKDVGKQHYLIAETTGNGFQLSGTSAQIAVETKRIGKSKTIRKLTFEKNPLKMKKFCRIKVNGVIGSMIATDATVSEMKLAVKKIYFGHLHLERRETQAHVEFFFLFVDNADNDVMLSAEIFRHCSAGSLQFCFDEIQHAKISANNNLADLSGTFTMTVFKSCPKRAIQYQCSTYTTNAISIFATAEDIEHALESIDGIEDVFITLSNNTDRLQRNLSIASGIVGTTKQFYIHFRMLNSNIFESPDIPKLVIDESSLKGTPTRDLATSKDYQSKVSEVVKGVSDNIGGSVSFEVSINAIDFSSTSTSFQYHPALEVKSLKPNHGAFFLPPS